jgi:hypothetical protein
MTRLGIEVKNLTMRVESMQSRLEFNERRARALESAVVYKPAEPETFDQMPRPPAHESRPPAEFRPRHDNQRHDNQRHESQRHETSQPSSTGAAQPQPSQGAPAPGSPEGQRRRRRRRRGRRGGGAGMPGAAPQGTPGGQPSPEGATGQPASAGEAASFDDHADDAGAGPFADEPEDSGPGGDSTPQ